MSSLAHSTTPAPPAITYARARLRLGIASVGTLVVVAACALVLDLPGAFLPQATSWSIDDALWLLAFFGVYVALSAPFDYFGGSRLPRIHGRALGAGSTVPSWARAVVVHGAMLWGAALLLLGAGRWGGEFGALGAAALSMLALLALQPQIARLVGGVRREGRALAGDDPSFVAGVCGLPAVDRVLPARGWDDEVATVQAARRRAQHRGGSRALGVGLAFAFNLAGLALVVFAAPGAGVDSVAGVVSVALWMTLWSFVGLLVLPSLSRGAVIGADLAAIDAGIAPDRLITALRRLDATQEDEPERSRLVESIFHPVPALSRRIAAIESGRGPRLPRPWHAARMALFLSWSSAGLLSRAVHCNCGRPALWVLFPGD